MAKMSRKAILVELAYLTLDEFLAISGTYDFLHFWERICLWLVVLIGRMTWSSSSFRRPTELVPRKAAPNGSDVSFGGRLRQNVGAHRQEAPRRQCSSRTSALAHALGGSNSPSEGTGAQELCAF